MSLATSPADALANTGLISSVSASQLAASDTMKPKASDSSASMQDNPEVKDVIARKDKVEKAEQKIPVIPTVENGLLKEEPKPDTSDDPMKGYVSAIGVLGAIGSMFTRVPMTRSMNAAAAAVGAMKAGDEEDFKKKYDAWKVTNDNTIAMLKYEQENYKESLENSKEDYKTRFSNLFAKAVANKDEPLIAYLKDQDYTGAQDFLDKRQTVIDKHLEASDKIEEFKQKRTEALEKAAVYKQWQQENPTAPADQKAAALARIFDPSVAAASVRANAAKTKEADKNKQNYDSAIGQIDDLIDMVDKSSSKGSASVTGLSGLVRRGAETVETMLPAGKDVATPASDFEGALDALKLQLPKLLTGTSKSASDERAQISKILRGTSPGDTSARTKNSLIQVKSILEKRRGEPSEDTGSSSGYNIGDEVTSPDGTKHRITGFDTDGTPLGDPVQ